MSARKASRTGGYTLIEILVVLILMGLAAALVVPAVVPPREQDASSFETLVRNTRHSAIRRGEIVYLTITVNGDWRLDGGASADEGAFASGRLADYDGPQATLIASPLGSCAFDVESGEASTRLPLRPLTCEVMRL